MSFPVIEQYKHKYPHHSTLLNEFDAFYLKKLWHELSQGILLFIFQKDLHGKLSFDFYTDFVKRFDRNIDPIAHLKILKECLANVDAQTAVDFLEKFEDKDAFSDQSKVIAASLRANYYINNDMDKCFELYNRFDKFTKERKDADPFAFSCIYRFAMNYFSAKKKQKAFYDHALQYMSYTSAEEIEQEEKIKLLAKMGIAVLTSKEIYNFSQLMEQPMLRSLAESPHRWIYELLAIFNKGDIETYGKVCDDALARDKQLEENKTALEQKIRLMSFLELAFNLPKSNRVVTFAQLAKVCAISVEHVEFMVMKAASLSLVKVQINQLAQEVVITWVAPKVLGSEKINTMLSKFQEWETGVEGVKNFITDNRKIVEA